MMHNQVRCRRRCDRQQGVSSPGISLRRGNQNRKGINSTQTATNSYIVTFSFSTRRTVTDPGMDSSVDVGLSGIAWPDMSPERFVVGTASASLDRSLLPCSVDQG